MKAKPAVKAEKPVQDKATATKTKHLPSWKQDELKEVMKLAKEYPNVGIASVDSLPAAQLGDIRKKVITDVKIYTTKKTIAKLAFEKAGRTELLPLLEKVAGPFSLLFSKANPFKVYALAKKNKSKTKAKPGQLAEKDIIVKEGDTGFPAGPALSDFKAAGLDVAPIDGKIKVRKDCVLVKKGVAITPKQAEIMGKLNMKPVEVGLNLRGMFELGTIYAPEVLDIDTEVMTAKFQTAFRNAVNLSVNAEYFTKDSTVFIVQNAFRKSLNLAVEASIPTKDSLPLILAKANAQAGALASKVKQ